MDDALTLAQKAAKDARRAAVLTGVAVMVAVVVLAIDNGIKRAVLEETQKARRILDEFRGLADKHTVRVEVAADGSEAAGAARAAAGDGVDAAGSVVHASPARAAGSKDADPAKPAPARRAARRTGGPRGDDGRASGA